MTTLVYDAGRHSDRKDIESLSHAIGLRIVLRVV
jgi:hypothetical protein